MNKPKRGKDKYNPYTLIDNNRLTFMDNRGNRQTVEVSEVVYNEFNKFELQDKKIMNEYDRHIEHNDTSEEILFHKSIFKNLSLEDEVIKKIDYENLYNEIKELPNIQKRRLVMYYFENMTLDGISKIENCSPRAVKYSIDIALKKLSKIDFKN